MNADHGFQRVTYTSFGLNTHIISTTAGASAVYPSANRAYFVPVRLQVPFNAVKMFCLNGATVSGNIDVGIYDFAGNKLVSKGTTVQAGTSVLQEFDITDTYLDAGLYYMAIAMDNTTGTLFRKAPAAIGLFAMGMYQAATSFVLPASPTFADISSAFLPFFGMTSRTTI